MNSIITVPAADRKEKCYDELELEALYQALVPPALRDQLNKHLPHCWDTIVQFEEEGLQTALIRWTHTRTAAKSIAPASYFLLGNEYRPNESELVACVRLHPDEGLLIVGAHGADDLMTIPVLVVGYHPCHGSDVQALMGIAAYDDFPLALRNRLEVSSRDAAQRVTQSITDFSRLVLPVSRAF